MHMPAVENRQGLTVRLGQEPGVRTAVREHENLFKPVFFFYLFNKPLRCIFPDGCHIIIQRQGA